MFVECLFCAGLWIRLGRRIQRKSDSVHAQEDPSYWGPDNGRARQVREGKAQYRVLGKAVYSQHEISRQVPGEFAEEE